MLYVDIPTGQNSFHSRTRGQGPDYPGQWDGQRGQSHLRAIAYAQGLLDYCTEQVVTPVLVQSELALAEFTPSPRSADIVYEQVTKSGTGDEDKVM